MTWCSTPPPETRASIDELKDSIVRRDDAVRRDLGDARVLGPDDGGFELYSVIGWKAANLAEIERLGGRGLVPPWFVVTDRAFQEALDAPLDKKIAETVEGLHDEAPIVSRGNRNHSSTERLEQFAEVAGHSAVVGKGHDPSTHCRRGVRCLLEALGGNAPGAPPRGGRFRPFVAIRSSGREEDTETATRAGEFDTFLFIRGQDSLLDHLKRAWSGLWTERAIHNREVMGSEFERAGGGDHRSEERVVTGLRCASGR